MYCSLPTLLFVKHGIVEHKLILGRSTYKVIFLLLVFCTAVSNLKAQEVQSGKIIGKITDQSGHFIPFVLISTDRPGIGIMADENGQFELSLQPGAYTLSTYMTGYISQSKQITIIAGETISLNFVLAEDVAQLETIVLKGKTEAEKLREEAYAIQFIETEQFKNVSTDVNQILNKTSGINIRQSGGLGSEFSMSLNGLSGNQVRTFINGVPMDYFGSSLSLNNFPANVISGIEIYKGVVPIHLSADALGGAINITTDKRPISYLDASYSVGSFNTHRASVNGQFVNDTTGLTFRAKSYYNYSDNNYKIDVQLWDSSTGKLAKEYTPVRRFHDAYKSGMVWLEGGFTNKKWADELMVGIMRAFNEKELQQPEMAQGVTSFPLGEVMNSEDKWIFNMAFSKKGLLKNKLSVGSYLVYIHGHNSMVDTSSNRYSWDGSYLANVNRTKGELSRKTLFDLYRNNLLGNFNVGYEVIKNHSLAINYSLNSTTVQGNDPLLNKNNTQFKDPSTINKQIIGLAYTNSLFNSRLKSTAFAKHYNYHIRSLVTDYNGDANDAFVVNQKFWGYGLASTYFVWANFQLKGSYEYAIRFPETSEIYGNGLNILSNPLLEPETSDNYNLGFRTVLKTHTHSRLTIDANTFIRDSKGFIRAESIGITTEYENQASVKTTGVDLNLQYNFKQKLKISGSYTYQRLKNSGKWLKGMEGKKTDITYGEFLPNQPSMFGSASISYTLSGLIQHADHFTISSLHNYTRWFYLMWPTLASAQDKATIPTQYSTDLEFTYQSQTSRYNASITLSNLLNNKLYDNYKQQRPGRAIAFKVRYFICSKS